MKLQEELTQARWRSVTVCFLLVAKPADVTRSGYDCDGMKFDSVSLRV